VPGYVALRWVSTQQDCEVHFWLGFSRWSVLLLSGLMGEGPCEVTGTGIIHDLYRREQIGQDKLVSREQNTKGS